MRAPRAALLGLAFGLSACRGCEGGSPAPVEEAGAPANSECEPRMGEQLSIPFAKLCPRDLSVAGARFEPFWIAAQQLGCSAGEHDSLSCPSATALQHPTLGETRAPSAAKRSLAAVVSASTAQTVCFMRFGGRLPTREERARAEAAMGLASVMVAQSTTAPTHFELIRLAEWVTETPCQTSNIKNCSPALYPSGGRRKIPWSTLAACEGTPLPIDAGTPLLAIDESCPAPDFAWDAGAGRLPCAVRSPALHAPVAGFALDCLAPNPATPHPEDDVEQTAAFRCVLPASAYLSPP